MSYFPEGMEDVIYYEGQERLPDETEDFGFSIEDLPWYALPNRERNIVKLFYLERISQSDIAKKFNITQPRVTKIIAHSTGLLKEYALYIKELKSNSSALTALQYKYMALFYIDGLTIKEISRVENKRKRAVQRVLSNGRKRLLSS